MTIQHILTSEIFPSLPGEKGTALTCHCWYNSSNESILCIPKELLIYLKIRRWAGFNPSVLTYWTKDSGSVVCLSLTFRQKQCLVAELSRKCRRTIGNWHRVQWLAYLLLSGPLCGEIHWTSFVHPARIYIIDHMWRWGLRCKPAPALTILYAQRVSAQQTKQTVNLWLLAWSSSCIFHQRVLVNK